MRIHGTLKIKRRELEITDWSKHKPELEEDFFGICGYCGKHFKATLCDSQIEHFIPKKKYPKYANKYSNLILACKVCNNKKRDDWPSNDPTKSITADGKEGYIDPATDEFDIHLEQSVDGNIIGKTDVGKYMAKRFGFDYRPMSETHKIKELYEAMQMLRLKKAQGDPSYSSEILDEVLLNLEDLRQQIHIQKE